MSAEELLSSGDDAEATTRARIRDTAIDCFARAGFGASVRTIAAEAGVSPGLITHHFGSKDALRAECDTEVLARYRALKSGAIDAPSDALLRLLPDPGDAAVLVVYMLRALAAGGPPARTFLVRLTDEARGIMKESLDAGLVRPSRDEEARLRYLVEQSMGALLLQFLTTPSSSPEDFVRAMLTSPSHETILPTLELYTEGLFASSDVLDTYLAHKAQEPHPAKETEVP
ncbi:TetR family transcriptional regulator [Xylanimonas sp. McL0601]|uniref:TetR/AcrR family transcriptional regulator n=1 Tax=Xylanimonas sp. McL0601 TaxID=3414739 RepID=UPI003CEC8A36